MKEKWIIWLTGFISYLTSTEFINSSGLNQIPKLGVHLACNDMVLDGNHEYLIGRKTRKHTYCLVQLCELPLWHIIT